MNRVKIKKEAREMIKGNIWTLLKPLLILFAVYFVIGVITGASAGTGEQANAGVSLLATVLEFATYPIIFGVLVYYVKFVRKENYDIKDLFGYYKKFWPIFALNFLVGLFTILWSLLFIIPGIIAAISYTMSMLIMIDGEDDPMACIKKSKAMMKGYKWDFFVFQLSFILWHLLGMVTFGLAYIYVAPYIQVADVLYYEDLRKIHPAE